MVVVTHVLKAVPLSAMHPDYEGPPDGGVRVGGGAGLQERVGAFEETHSGTERELYRSIVVRENT